MPRELPVTRATCPRELVVSTDGSVIMCLHVRLTVRVAEVSGITKRAGTGPAPRSVAARGWPPPAPGLRGSRSCRLLVGWGGIGRGGFRMPGGPVDTGTSAAAGLVDGEPDGHREGQYVVRGPGDQAGFGAAAADEHGVHPPVEDERA